MTLPVAMTEDRCSRVSPWTLPVMFGGAAYYGSDGYGAVVELAKQKSGYQEKTLLDFTGSNGGYLYGNMLVDAKGNLYGTTFRGGNLGCNTVQQGCGVVFEMKP